MPETASLAGLFASAFLSATLLPGSSEVVLLGLLALRTAEPALLVAVATVGNVLGSLVNYLLGRFLAHFADRPWFPIKPQAYERAVGWYRRLGVWSLLLAWVPVIGDTLTAVLRQSATAASAAFTSATEKRFFSDAFQSRKNNKLTSTPTSSCRRMQASEKPGDR